MGRRPVESLLFAAVHSSGSGSGSGPLPEQVCRLAARADQEALLQGALHHRVVPALYLQLSGCSDLPEATVRRLADAYRAHIFAHLLSVRALSSLSAALDAAAIAHVAFKGPILAEAFYPRPDLRMYADLDVMVSPSQARAAYDLLMTDGAQPISGDWDETRREELAQVSMRTRSGTVVDLHWHYFSLPSFRHEFPVDIDEILARRVPVDIGGHQVHTLSIEDTLLHLCAHTCFSGGNRLIWFSDIAAVVQRGGFDWDLFMARARAARLSLVAATMLERARQVTGVGIPDPAIDGLAPRRGWRRLLTSAERVRPLPRTLSGRMTGELLVLATQDSSRSSLRKLGSMLWVDVVKPVATDPTHPWRVRWGPTRTLSNPP